MIRTVPFVAEIYTVICRWNPATDMFDPWQTVVVSLSWSGNAEGASSEACLFLICKRMGQAVPVLVTGDQGRFHIPGNGIFDASEYDDAITFGAHIHNCIDLH